MKKLTQMISVRKNENGTYEVVNGLSRLKEVIEHFGKAEVTDLSTGHTLVVHELDGSFVALSEEANANLEDQVLAVIHRAKP